MVIFNALKTTEILMLLMKNVAPKMIGEIFEEKIASKFLFECEFEGCARLHIQLLRYGYTI